MVLDRPDAVFSGNRAAQRNRQLGNIAKNFLGGSVFFWSIVGLHGWMQITIAGVSHDGDGPTVVLCSFVNATKHIRQLSDGYANIARNTQTTGGQRRVRQTTYFKKGVNYGKTPTHRAVLAAPY